MAGPYLEQRSIIDRSCFGLNVQRAARVISRKFDLAFKPFGINHWQFDMLVVLSTEHGLNVGEVANSLAADRTTISSNLKPLIRAGLLTVRVDEKDARSRRIELTLDGVNLVKAAYPAWKQVNDGLSRSVGDPESDAFLKTLASVITNA